MTLPCLALWSCGQEKGLFHAFGCIPGLDFFFVNIDFVTYIIVSARQRRAGVKMEDEEVAGPRTTAHYCCVSCLKSRRTCALSKVWKVYLHLWKDRRC